MSVLLCVLLTLSIVVDAQTPGRCLPGAVCEFEKCSSLDGEGTCCRCGLWFPDGACAPAGWQRVNGTGTCDFEVTAPEPGSCLPGIECDHYKCANRDDPATCCDCEQWNPDGSCTAVGWIPRVNGQDCDFEVSEEDELVSEDAPAQERNRNRISPYRAVGQPVDDVALPSQSAEEEDAPDASSHPETPQPCPDDAQCDTVRCGIVHGEQICCECLIRRPNGKCRAHGWFLPDSMDEECPL